jgi:cytochrome c553
MPRTILGYSLTGLIGILAAPVASAQNEEFFERQIRPILTTHCVSCHGPKVQKSKFRLDTREGLLLGGEGGEVVKPGDRQHSRLMAAVRHSGELKMPETKLADRDIMALEKWVALGLPWPESIKLIPPDKIGEAARKHWAFQPIQRPKVPELKDSKSDLRNPIDHFVLARLRTANLQPSPAADRRTLIRRASFDLLGLPPTPEEVAAFEADLSPDAYEKLIDRLLASPRYGERWARHWLDVARYADNKGYVFFEDKQYPWAYTYRDYVIDAFNRDLPYDRFILDQVAADQVGDPNPKTLAALGFLTLGGHFMNNTHDIIDDRIDVVTRGLLGLTVTCARCHDHKFDPIPQADYYSLYGVFRSSQEPMVPPLCGAPPDTDDYRKNAKDLADKEKKLVDYVTAKHSHLVNQARTRVAEYLLAAHAARNQPPADDFMLISDVGDLNPTMITRWRVYLEETQKRSDPVWVVWHQFARVAELDFAAHAGKVVEQLKNEKTINKLVLEKFATKPASMKEVAERYGKLLVEIDKEWREVSSKSSVEKLSDPTREELRQVLYGPRAPADAPMTLDWGFLSLFPERATQDEYKKLLKDVETSLSKGPPRAPALVDAAKPYDPRIFLRGQPGRLGDYVPRQFLQVVNSQRKPFAKGSGRLELAREMVAKSNPLTARVLVNRIWLHHFGKGLVATPSDFGLRSDPPSHPELLDYLASEVIETGWSIKKLQRRIMTSACYKQASLDRETGLSVDPENRLLWKMNRQRLDFESLHDSILFVSGNLDLTMGGPPVGLFGGSTRRAVYGYVDRLEFPSLLTTFDVPSPAISNPQRSITTVTPQSLYLMNGPFARSAARKLLASEPIKKLNKAPERVDALFSRILNRKPNESERKQAIDFVAKGPEAERWLDLAHGLLMTNEFAFVD